MNRLCNNEARSPRAAPWSRPLQSPAEDFAPRLEALLVRWRHGEAGAREELCAAVLPRLLSYLQRAMGSRPRRWIAPEDLAQVVAVETLRDIEKLSASLSPDELMKRLYRRAQWRIRDVLRNHRREIGESALPTAALQAAAAETPSSGPVTREDERRWLTDLVARLPPAYADVVRLCGLQGLGYAEAGNILRLAPDTVRKRYERAKERLAEHVARRARHRA